MRGPSFNGTHCINPDDEYLALVDKVYGVDREEPCVHGHFDCAEFEGGPCAGETLDRLIREAEAAS